MHTLNVLDPGEKINGCYYREELLNQHTAGVWRLLRVTTRECTGAQGTQDNQAAATGDARIHLTRSVASE